METKFTYDYPRPAVTVDVVILRLHANRLETLLVRRAREPYAGRWCFPGGYVDIDETLAHAAARELREETGIDNVALAEVGAFDAPGRDPRGRVISIAHAGVVTSNHPAAKAGDDAADAAWFPAAEPPPLGFDHRLVLAGAVRWLAVTLGVIAAAPLWPPDITPQEQAAFRKLIAELFSTQEQGNRQQT